MSSKALNLSRSLALGKPFIKAVVLGQEYPKRGEFDQDRITFAVKWKDGLPESIVSALQNYFPKRSDVNGNK